MQVSSDSLSKEDQWSDLSVCMLCILIVYKPRLTLHSKIDMMCWKCSHVIYYPASVSSVVAAIRFNDVPTSNPEQVNSYTHGQKSRT
jgi:hypothetical protein